MVEPHTDDRNTQPQSALLNDGEIDIAVHSADHFTRIVLPEIFHRVDQASIQSQRRHLNYFRWNLILIVLAATPPFLQAWFSYFINENQTSLLDLTARSTALLAALFFAGTLIVNFLIRLRQYDRDWYQGRALAESIKSVAWKYMMVADPYGPPADDEEAERRYLSDVQEILAAAPKLTAIGGVREAPSTRITSAMRIIRAKDAHWRRDCYGKFRIEDEWQWYSRKAAQHTSSEHRLFHAVIACQFIALFLAMLRIAWPKTPLHFGPVLAALAASFLAWSQLRRFGEQAIAYSMAARDLEFISEQSRFIHNDSDLARYVADAENAISREHTMWMARREVSGPKSKSAQK